MTPDELEKAVDEQIQEEVIDILRENMVQAIEIGAIRIAGRGRVLVYTGTVIEAQNEIKRLVDQWNLWGWIKTLKEE